jgi:hypothetical protein
MAAMREIKRSIRNPINKNITKEETQMKNSNELFI